MAVAPFGCGGNTQHTNAGDAGATADASDSGGAPSTPVAPWWTLPAGSRYFSRDGRQTPLLMRNISAPSVAAFLPLLEAAHRAGARAVRIQLTQGFGYDTLGIDSHGAVLKDWAASWDSVIKAARAQDLAVIPVFGIWGDWNNGDPDQGWVHFNANPLNQALGGPAASPAELFQDSATQRAWLGWLAQLIDRWQDAPNIIAWEIFSELDLATGGTAQNATHFAEIAADLIHAHDPAARPVFASTSDLPLISGEPWLDLWQGRGADLVSIHPYDPELDETVATRVAAALAATAKPVFIGESGLDAAAPDGTTLTSMPSARAGMQPAVWTELTSGAASARALYWEDGYAAYYPQTGLPLVHALNDLDEVAARWLTDADYTGLAPIGAVSEPPVFGSLLANQTQVRGFLRSKQLAPPDWVAPPLPAVQLSISFFEPTRDGEWAVTFTTPSGEPLPVVHATSRRNVLEVTSPPGFTSLAFVAAPVPPP